MRTVSKTGIHWLGEPGASQDPATVGGKAANLSLLAARFTVPPGFCVVGASTDGEPPSTDGEPALAEDAIRAAYRELSHGAGDVAVAVRSSAVDEDGEDASFAGQNETFLNVRGAAAVIAAVRDCVASFGSERARSYRRQRGLGDVPRRYAVLVQRLVVADVAGVAFSVDPVTGDPDHVLINAAWGLGESVVGGAVTPDTYLFDTTADAVVPRVAVKEVMTVATPGGTAEVRVPERLREHPCLDDAAVRTTARLAVDLEKAMGRPVDVEFAWAGDRLHLLQCRPVTTSVRQRENGAEA
ncbi:PEP/pyruvate-binding domain-containing protein [Saccharothrix sp. HUAS TT1]|uniref:PEP/pyruvate-binding domain-containing protein n=1 Tax=unclassified Saccharothrix TaxID=2593673 RepID=UPI00345B523B